MSRAAYWEVPPFSLPEQRRINVFPQFSMIVCASAPYVELSCETD
jgi:hypothetical protein